MAKKSDQSLDSIFDSTNGAKTGAKSGAKKGASRTASRKGAAPAATEAVADTGGGSGGGAGGNGGSTSGFTPDRFVVLKTILKNLEAEALYRKGKEDRLLMGGITLAALITVGAFLVRALCSGCAGCGWFYSLVFRSFFALMVGLSGFTVAAMIELNRTRLQDVLASIVKIHERFHLFDEGEFDDTGSAFLPNSYKFIGSTNDDETNYALLVVKVGSIVSAVALFLLV